MSVLKNVQVIGYQHAKGVGKTSGNPYEFANISYLTKGEAWENDKGKQTLLGLQVREINCASSLDFQKNLMKFEGAFPTFLDLHLSPDPTNPTRNIVTHVEVSKGE